MAEKDNIDYLIDKHIEQFDEKRQFIIDAIKMMDGDKVPLPMSFHIRNTLYYQFISDLNNLRDELKTSLLTNEIN